MDGTFAHLATLYPMRMEIMRRLLVALALSAISFTGLGIVANAQQDAGAGCPTEEILVKVLPDANPTEVVERHGGTILWTIEGIDVQVVAVPAGTTTQKVDELNADPDVKYAEPNGEVRATQQSSGAACPSPSPTTP